MLLFFRCQLKMSLRFLSFCRPTLSFDRESQTVFSPKVREENPKAIRNQRNSSGKTDEALTKEKALSPSWNPSTSIFPGTSSFNASSTSSSASSSSRQKFSIDSKTKKSAFGQKGKELIFQSPVVPVSKEKRLWSIQNKERPLLLQILEELFQRIVALLCHRKLLLCLPLLWIPGTTNLCWTKR